MKKALLAVTLLLFWASFAVGQKNGMSTFSASDNFAVDSINLTNLVPSINIPIVLKGAGPINGSLRLELNDSCFVTGTVWTCNGLGSTGSQGAVFLPIVQEMIGMTPAYTTFTSGGCTRYTITGVFGSDMLSFYPVASTTIFSPPVACGAQTATGVKTTDGSGYTFGFDVGGGVVNITTNSSAAGWTINSIGTTITDAFSNTLTDSLPSGNLTDALGAVTSYTASPAEYTYKDTTGTSQNVTLTSGTSHTFVPLGGTNCSASGSNNNFTPITAINYPDGTSYSFGWQTNGTGLSGLINSITLRTGGQISYAYTWNTSCTAGGWGFSSLTRTTPDGSWNYTTSTASQVTTTTVKDPGLNKVVYTFGGSGTIPTVLSEIDRYQNTGSVGTPAYTLISKTTYCYNSPCVTNPTYPITIRQTDEYLGSGSTHMSQRVEDYDSYGNVTSDATTDEITSQTITTTIVYGTDVSGTCSAITNTAIVDHPCTITTKNGSTWLSESTYTYNSNGALTSSSACLSSTCTGSSALTTTYTPTTQGTYSAIQDPNGQTVNYTYGSCNSLMPTDVTTTVNSIAIDRKATWNCDAGVVTDTTDPNSNEDDYTYDSMNRISTYHDRMGDTNTTSYAYGTPTLDHVKVTDNIGVVSYQYVDGLGRPTNSQVCQTSGCSNLDTSSTSYAWNGVNFETKTYVPCVQTTLNTACTTVAVTADVNPMGPYTTTDANSGTGAVAVNSKDWSFTAGPAVTQEHTKVVQTEMDGFGRTTSVCALESSGGTSCGQTMGNSGILTSSVYSFATGAPKVVTTRGSQSHTTIADAVGRPASVQTPEAGTTTYTYDSIASGICNAGASSSAGDLVETVDAASNKICRYYEGLHRLTDIDNSNESSTNTCRRFRYDSVSAAKIQNAPTGYPVSGNNLIGRMFEAETDNCVVNGQFPFETAITDEWFAYDKMGRMTDMWELSPNSSSNYRHTTVAYDADGVITSLSGLPGTGVGTLTYGVDGEDRWKTATLGTTTVVSGVTYDAASRATEVDFWSGTDKDTYSYDNVGNPTEYKFTIGSHNNDGVLTWSSNGSLRQLAITDGFNSNNTQTCKFGTSTTAGYDDVARILDDDCGSVWAQTYSYDQYDNLTKAGSLSWNPGYSSTNNEYQNGATYDSNGNLTKDATGGNTYTWNVYGNMASENSTNASYDAFGNMVAYGSYEFLYSPMGKLGVLTSGSPTAMAVPMPSGMGTIDPLGNNTIYVYHHDWIGSSRTVANQSSTVAWSKSFSPYGDVYNSSGSVDDRFAGMDADTFDGLTYTAANRSLGMNASRWLSPDPAHSGWNAYAYVTDPNTETDPSGLEPPQNDDLLTSNLKDCKDTEGVGPCANAVGVDMIFKRRFPDASLESNGIPANAISEGNFIGNVGQHGSAMFFNMSPATQNKIYDNVTQGVMAGLSATYLANVIIGGGNFPGPLNLPRGSLSPRAMDALNAYRRGIRLSNMVAKDQAEGGKLVNDMRKAIWDTGGAEDPDELIKRALREGEWLLLKQDAGAIASTTMRGAAAVSGPTLFVFTNVQQTLNENQDTTHRIPIPSPMPWGDFFGGLMIYPCQMGFC